MDESNPTLRPVTESDASLIASWFRDPAVSQFLDPHARGMDDVRKLIENAQSNDPWTLRGIAINDRLIGYCGVDDLDTMLGKAQVGIVIGAPSCWGRGIGKQVMTLLLEHCFEDFELHRALAIVACGNERSIRLFESLGFVHEGTLRGATLVQGVRTDLLCYSMLKDEYRARSSSSRRVP